MPKTQKTRKKRTVLSNDKLKSIVLEYACNWKLKDCRRLGSKYNVSHRTIYRIFKRCDQFKDNNNNNDIWFDYQYEFSHNGKRAEVAILETTLKKYLERMRQMKKKVSFEKLTSMGYKCRRELLRKMETEEEFKTAVEEKEKGAYSKLKKHKVSRGFVQKFLKRSAGNNGKSKRLFGKAGDVDDEDEERIKILNSIKSEIKNVHPSYLWNMDESGIQYQKLPDRTYLAKFEKRKVSGTSDGGNEKARLSFITCVNGIGEKFQMAIIGKAKRPMCFYKAGSKTNIDLPCLYFGQQCAWMDTCVFNSWLFNHFIPFLKANYPPGKKHFLNVDNFSGHVPNHNNETVKIQYLPPNSTSTDQVCDQGVIRSLQVYYKYALLNILADFEQVSLPGLFKAPKLRPDPGRGRRGIKDGRMPHVLDAMELMTKAWDKVSDISIIKCWKKTNLFSPYHLQIVDAILAKRGRPDDPTLESKLPLSTVLDMKAKLQTLTIPKYADFALKKSLQELRDVSSMVDENIFCDLFHRYLKIQEDFREDTLCDEIISEVNVDIKDEEEMRIIEDEKAEEKAKAAIKKKIAQEHALIAIKEAFGSSHELTKKVQNEVIKSRSLCRTVQTDIRTFINNTNSVVIKPSTFNVDAGEAESNMSDAAAADDDDDDVAMQDSFSHMNLDDDSDDLYGDPIPESEDEDDN